MQVIGNPTRLSPIDLRLRELDARSGALLNSGGSIFAGAAYYGGYNARQIEAAGQFGQALSGVAGASYVRGQGRAPIVTIRPEVHKNSLSYVGDTFVYAVRGPNGAWKIGESAQGLQSGGDLTVRGEAQARQLRASTGQFYESVVLNGGKPFATKAQARSYETRAIETFRRLYGNGPNDLNLLPGNKTNR
jgi:hypothetical protein